MSTTPATTLDVRAHAPRPRIDAQAHAEPDDRTARVAYRAGTAEDAPAILRLIEDNLQVGHLLPRTLQDLAAHAGRFVVATADETVIGCAELAPLSLAVAEVRSLVVGEGWRGRGLGTRLISTLQRQARVAGFATLCAFTHEPAPFVRLGFSIAPHLWFPEKIAIDCTGCPKFRTCGQHAMALALDGVALQPAATSYRRLPITGLAYAPFRSGQSALPAEVQR